LTFSEERTKEATMSASTTLKSHENFKLRTFSQHFGKIFDGQ
jgi:hypothetical protein